MKGGCKEDEARLIAVVPSARKSQWTQNEKQDILSKHHLAFYSVDDGAQAQIAQIRSRVTSLTMFKKHLNVVLGNLL